MKSTVGFVLALIGGIMSIASGISSLIQSFVAYYFPEIVKNIPNLAVGDSKNLLLGGVIGFIWLVLMGILAIIASVKMTKKNNELVKQGGILALIAGILSINLLIIIGGAVGIGQAGKKSKGR